MRLRAAYTGGVEKMSEEALDVTPGGFPDHPVPRITHGEGFSLISRPGGRLEVRLTGWAKALVRDVCRETGASEHSVVAATLIIGLRELA
jgi:hypothetical protein